MIRWKSRWALMGMGLALAGQAIGQEVALEKGTNEVDRTFQEMLKQAAEQDRSGRGTNAPNDALLGFDSKLTFEQIEALFLNGSLSARQFQFYINNRRTTANSREEQTQAIHDQAIAVLRDFQADPAKNPKPGPALKADQLPLLNEPSPPSAETSKTAGTSAPPPDPLMEGFELIEAKMEELLRLKQARDQATNEPSSEPAAQASQRTKRERLNDLLRLHIAGKIGEAEYNERRSQVIAEPESKQ